MISTIRIGWLSTGLLFAMMNAVQAAPRAAIFPFELIDTSLEGEVGGQAAETRRLALVTEELRGLLRQGGRYELADLSGLASEMEKAAPLHKCNGCETDLARTVGAEFAITGTVQKVSSLILNLNIYVREVATGKMTRAMSADIRGNTDETWLRGIRWLVANRLLAER